MKDGVWRDWRGEALEPLQVLCYSESVRRVGVCLPAAPRLCTVETQRGELEPVKPTHRDVKLMPKLLLPFNQKHEKGDLAVSLSACLLCVSLSLSVSCSVCLTGCQTIKLQYIRFEKTVWKTSPLNCRSSQRRGHFKRSWGKVAEVGWRRGAFKRESEREKAKYSCLFLGLSKIYHKLFIQWMKSHRVSSTFQESLMNHVEGGPFFLSQTRWYLKRDKRKAEWLRARRRWCSSRSAHLYFAAHSVMDDWWFACIMELLFQVSWQSITQLLKK